MLQPPDPRLPEQTSDNKLLVPVHVLQFATTRMLNQCRTGTVTVGMCRVA